MGEEKNLETPSIGFLGAGEWPEEQSEGLEEAADVYNIDYDLNSVQDIRPEDDIDWLRGVETEYFRDEDITNRPQDGFLEGLDLIYVANRIDQHSEQVDNLLEEINDRGLDTSIAVEKALSPGREDHHRLNEKAKNYGVEMELMDHYEFKPQALKLEAGIYQDREGIPRESKITAVKFTAKEASDPSDRERQWIFEEDMGGIGLDWLPHPYSIMISRLGARFEDEDLSQLRARPSNYDIPFLGEDTPAGVEVSSPVSGENFAEDAVFTCEVGKRYDETEKKIEIEYETGDTLELELTDNAVGIDSNTYAASRLLDMAMDRGKDVRDDPALDRMRPVYTALDGIYGESRTGEMAQYNKAPIND